MSGFAQTYSPVKMQGKTIGYRNDNDSTITITTSFTTNEFNNIKNYFSTFNYLTVLDTGLVIGDVIKNPQPLQINQQLTNTDLRGIYLTRAGQYKNASVGVSVGTSALIGVILASPAHTVAEYNTKVKIASVLTTIGGAISFGLNIAGNNMLIKAGLVTQ